jgi:hypothetical protein
MGASVKDKFIDRIRAFKPVEPVRGIASVYSTFNEFWLYVRFSNLVKTGRFWFDVDTYKVLEWRDTKRFIVCLVCGDESNVIFVPDDKLFEWCEDATPNRKGLWLITVVPKGDSLMLRPPGARAAYDVSEYVNRYDFISKSIPEPVLRRVVAPPPGKADEEQVTASILMDTSLEGASLHERLVDMLVKIGKWAGYAAERSYKVPPDSPYQIDVVWMRNDLLEVAMEVQVGGSESEAKDRLIHARRFGARKVIVVSAAGSVNRIKNICRYEPDLKNWLEIWSISKTYEMYTSGAQFFGLFRPFERQQWREEISHIA